MREKDVTKPFAPRAILARLRAGPSTRPDAAGWRAVALAAGLYAVFAWSFGFATGLYVFEPRLDLDLARFALGALIVPALGEELAFRAAPVPRRAEARTAWTSGAVALVAYLAWHPINAALFFPAVLTYFSDARFLIVTAALGLACTYAWRRTGSIWPPVLLHWAAVMIWKGLLGAPRVL